MPVKLHRYGSNNVRVSTQWLVVLRAADRKRVGFVVTSGARDELEQKDMIRRKGCWSSTNRTGAACPWWGSNHVVKSMRFLLRVRRPDKFRGPAHALDVSTIGGGEQRLQNWLNSHRGVRVRGQAINPVPGEAWHLEISRAALAWLYFKYRRPR